MELASIAVLAGGKSSRFEGQDKQKALFLGEPLGRRVVNQALLAGCRVVVVGQEKELYADLPVQVVPDRLIGCGPLSGLHAALRETSSPWVYLMACDMPFFSLPWFSHLLGLAEAVGSGREGPKAIAAVREGRIEPFHALYSASLASDLERFLDDAVRKGEGRALSFHRFVKARSWLEVPEQDALGILGGWSLFSGANDRESLSSLERISPGL